MPRLIEGRTFHESEEEYKDNKEALVSLLEQWRRDTKKQQNFPQAILGFLDRWQSLNIGSQKEKEDLKLKMVEECCKLAGFGYDKSQELKNDLASRTVGSNGKELVKL